MSGKLQGQVYERVLDHAEAAILGAMADHAKDDGSRCFPSVGLLAWKTNYSERNVQRVMKRLEEMGVIIPVAYVRGGRGLATEYQIDLSKADAKPPYKPSGNSLPANLRIATIARFGRVCQGCLLEGDHGKGPDGEIWKIPRIRPDQPYHSENVTLSCETCAQEKGDILADTQEDLAQDVAPDDTQVADPPWMAGKGDIAGSPQPSSTNQEEPEDEPTDEDGDADDDDSGYPFWFLPMFDLHGYVNRDNLNFVKGVEEICEDPKVPATPELLVLAFARYYRANRIERGWKDPVAALRNTMEREIAKIGRMTPRQKEDLLLDREGVLEPAEPVVVGTVEAECLHCLDTGYFVTLGFARWCDHSGIRDPEAYIDPVLDQDALKEGWDETLVILEGMLPRPTFETWFKGLRWIGTDQGKALVMAPNAFAVTWLNRRMWGGVQKAFRQTVGGDLEVEFIHGGELAQEEAIGAGVD